MTNNLWNFLQPSLENYASETAWVMRKTKPHRITHYQEIYDLSLNLAAQLRNKGIGSGDTVALCAPEGPEWVSAALAIWKLDAVLSPIHFNNSTYDIEQQINAIAPKCVLKDNIALDFTNCYDISELLQNNDTTLIEAEKNLTTAANPDDVAARLYTSGSTGTPKIVRLSHNNLMSNAKTSTEAFGPFGPDDRFISLLPFSHAMGMMVNFLIPCYNGVTLVAPKAISAEEIITTLHEHQITIMIAVPRLYRNIVQGLQKKIGKGSPLLRGYIALIRALPVPLKALINGPILKKLGGKIKLWGSGGSHLDPTISQYIHDLGIPLRQAYGLTETSPISCSQDIFDPYKDSIGKPIPGVSVTINNPDASGAGELWIKGPNVMLGYEDAQQNAAAFEDGWFKTGDIAVISDNGYVTLTGRQKRLIVTDAGKNVYPEEIEILLERDPRVKEAGVFDLDNKPACILSLNSIDDDTSEPQTVVKKILHQFNRLVSAHSRISKFCIVDELPRTPLGKIALKELPNIYRRKIKGTSA